MGDNGPPAMIRHILLTLSVRMTRNGDRAFPSTKTIAARTGRSERTTCTHLKHARVGKWLLILRRPGGRSHQYFPSIPGQTLPEVQELVTKLLANGWEMVEEDHAEDGSVSANKQAHEGLTERPSGPAEEGDSNKRKDVQPSSPCSISESSSLPPASPPIDATTDDGARHIERRDDRYPWFADARRVLIEHCLRGQTTGVDQNGYTIGIGLLVRQLAERVALGNDVSDWLGAVAEVRRDEDAPPPDAAFSFRWFDANPGRFDRCLGAHRKRDSALALSGRLPIKTPQPVADLVALARQKLDEARLRYEGGRR